MLNKKFRLNKKKDIANIFRKTKPTYTKGLIFRSYYQKKNEDAGVSRFLFIISTKVEKRAVYRNQIRRRLQAISQELISSIKKGYDIIVIVKPGQFPDNYNEIKKEFLTGLDKSNLFNDK